MPATGRPRPLRVLVVGGGIGGLAAAIAVRRAGHVPVVLERAASYRPVGAGLALWANGLAALAALGVRDDALAAAPPLEGAFYRSDGRVLARTASPWPQAPERPLGRALHRAELQRALLAALGPADVRTGAVCTGATQDVRSVRATLEDGGTVEGDALVGADGVRSTVRSLLPGSPAPRYAGYTTWRGVADAAPAEPRAGESWGRGLRFGRVPLAGGRTYWFAVEGAPAGLALPEGEAEHLRRRFGGWHTPIPALLEATPSEALVRTDVYDLPPLERWTVGRVALLGDAAHAMTPDLGQGACQALEDAVVLGRCLEGVGASDVPRALRRFEAARRPRVTLVQGRSRGLGRVAQWSNPLACLARDALLAAAPARVRAGALAPLLGYDALAAPLPRT